MVGRSAVRRRLQYWSLALIILAALGVGATYLATDWHVEEPQNYSKIEDGLYMGGDSSEPWPF